MSLVSRTNLVAMIVATAFFMQTLDSTIVATALPEIAQSFGTSPVHLSTAITAYLLSLAVFIPISGWLSDRFGARTVFQAAIVVFTIGSLFCALANNIPQMMAARLLQGAGGAMLVPVGRTVVLRTAAKHEFVRAMSFLSVPAQLGPVLGPPLGGFITTYASWRWIFLINIPVGLLGIYLTARHIENHRESTRWPLDWLGFIVGGIAMSGLMYALDAAGRGSLDPVQVWGCGVVGILFTGWAVWHGLRHEHPLLDFRLVRIPSFWMNFTPGTLFRAGAGSLPFLLPLFFQTVFGMSAFQSGMLTFASAIGAVTMRVQAPQALKRFGFRNVLLYNGAICVATIWACGFFQMSTPKYLIMLVLLIGGFFQALQLAALNTVAYIELQQNQMSAATSLAQLLQQIGKGFGVALSAIVLNVCLAMRHSDQPAQIDFLIAFSVVAVIAAIGVPLYAKMTPGIGDDFTGHKPTPSGSPAKP